MDPEHLAHTKLARVPRGATGCSVKVAVNAVSAKSGGAASRLQSLLPALDRRTDVELTIYAARGKARVFAESCPRGRVVEQPDRRLARRLLWEQLRFPRSRQRARRHLQPGELRPAPSVTTRRGLAPESVALREGWPRRAASRTAQIQAPNGSREGLRAADAPSCGGHHLRLRDAAGSSRVRARSRLADIVHRERRAHPPEGTRNRTGSEVRTRHRNGHAPQGLGRACGRLCRRLRPAAPARGWTRFT